jgi:hypothetical protein
MVMMVVMLMVLGADGGGVMPVISVWGDDDEAMLMYGRWG